MPYLLSKEYILGRDEVLKKVLSLLKGKKPDVIVGISMGGLLAPHLAKLFPESKLMLIGTAAYFKTKISLYNWLVKLEAGDERLILVRLLKLTPKWLYGFFYKLVNKNKDLTDREMQSRADENYEKVFEVPINEIKEILKMVRGTNNLKILWQMPNKTLIIAGKHDKIMPVQLSKEMNSVMKNSKLMVSEGFHYDVFGEVDYAYVDNFLN